MYPLIDQLIPIPVVPIFFVIVVIVIVVRRMIEQLLRMITSGEEQETPSALMELVQI
jgi:hypothetical protein